MTEEDKKLWKAVTDTVVPLGSSGGKRRPTRASVVQEPRVLDLHGMSVQRAFEEARDFIARTPHKKVTVITGRSGQIRAEFERWLEGFNIKTYSLLNDGSFEIKK